MGITPYLDTVHISEDEGFRKPAASLFLKVAEKLGAAPGEVLFVGDTFEADVDGAAERGHAVRLAQQKGCARSGGRRTARF